MTADTTVLTTDSDKAMVAYLDRAARIRAGAAELAHGDQESWGAGPSNEELNRIEARKALIEIAMEEEAYANLHFHTPEKLDNLGFVDRSPTPLHELETGDGPDAADILAHNPDDGIDWDEVGRHGHLYDCEIAWDCTECPDYNRCADLALMMEV